MTEITWRTRADGPGWTPEHIQEVAMSQARVLGATDPLSVYRLACSILAHDLAEQFRGGMYRPPTRNGQADVKVDDLPPIT